MTWISAQFSPPPHGQKPSVVQIRAEDVSPDVIGKQVIAALRQMAADGIRIGGGRATYGRSEPHALTRAAVAAERLKNHIDGLCPHFNARQREEDSF
jgi:hypothetical protein